MTETYQATDGTDIDLDVSPDTPATWARIHRTVAELDKFLTHLHGYTGWRITLELGPTTISATPAMPDACLAGETPPDALPDPSTPETAADAPTDGSR